MPEAGRSAKGFQDSAVQSGGGTSPQDDTDTDDAAPHGPAGDGAKSADPPPAEETDEPDRVAIVELETTQLVAEFDLMMPAAEGKALSPYPDFPETNPFRLAVREPPPPHPPPPPSVRVRPPSGSQLARRRGSPSDLTVVLPNVSAGTGSGAALLAQRAVGDCEPELAAIGGGDGDGHHHLHRGRGEMERRDSIWDRLPPPDQLEQRRLSDCQESASGAGRLLRSPFPQLGQPAPTPDQTNDEGRELFLEFVHDRIVEEGIPEDELALQAQNDDTINRIMCLPGLSNPVWAQTGTELRALADAFATSHQRQELRSKAQCTDLTDISWDRFRQLLEELFSGEAGVTQERILVLFFFLSDCVVSTIRRHAWTHLRRLIEWSLRYIVERVCALVQEAGGWGVVLRQSAEYLYLGLKITALSLVCVAAFVYIRKH